MSAWKDAHIQVDCSVSPDAGIRRLACSTPRRGGRVAEGGGLLNRCTGKNLYPGFESLPLRQNNLLLTRNQP
jgi:hypothetical protein